MKSGLRMIFLTRIYTRIRIQRSGAAVGSNGVRHKASIRQQSTRDFFLSRCYDCSYWRQRSKYLKAFTGLIYLSTASNTMTFVSKESDSSPHKSTSRVILQY